MRNNSIKNLSVVFTSVANAQIITGGNTKSKTTASGAIDFEATTDSKSTSTTSSNQG